MELHMPTKTEMRAIQGCQYQMTMNQTIAIHAHILATIGVAL